MSFTKAKGRNSKVLTLRNNCKMRMFRLTIATTCSSLRAITGGKCPTSGQCPLDSAPTAGPRMLV
jgi:hypothetical protein